MIKRVFVKAESMFRRGKGQDKFLFVCNFLRRKTLFLVPLFIIKFIVKKQYEKHEVFINNLIIRDKVRI